MGNQKSSDGRGAAGASRMSAAARMGSASRKWTMFATTATTGSTSAGNSTFLIRLPLATSELPASVRPDENHVQGSRPQKRNRAYGSISTGRNPSRTTEKTNV